MDPVSILSVLGTSITIIKNVSGILNTVITQTKNADRSLQQLCREVADFQNLLQRMREDLADPSMEIAALETQTGNVGAHCKAVRQAISRCNERLEQLEELLCTLTGASTAHSIMPSKLLKPLRLNFAESDIQFYRSEIKDYKDNIALTLQMMVWCRVMDGRLAPHTEQTDLVAIENEIRRLRKEIRAIRISEGATPSSIKDLPQSHELKFSTQRKLLPNDIEKEPRPCLDLVTIRNRRLETANTIEPTLDYASALISTASTYLSAGLSVEDQRRIDEAHSNPALLNFVEGQTGVPLIGTSSNRARKRESNGRTTCMLVPRLLASGFLLALFLTFLGFAIAIIILWSIFTICTACTRLSRDKSRIERDIRAVLNWFDEMYREIWGRGSSY